MATFKNIFTIGDCIYRLQSQERKKDSTQNIPKPEKKLIKQ